MSEMDTTKYEGHTPGLFVIVRSPKPDNTGGFDYAIMDENDRIVAEVFEHVGEGAPELGYEKRPAYENARLFADAPLLLAEVERLTQKNADLRNDLRTAQTEASRWYKAWTKQSTASRR